MKNLLVLFFIVFSVFCLNCNSQPNLFDVFKCDAEDFYITQTDSFSIKNNNNSYQNCLVKLNKSNHLSLENLTKNVSSQCVVINNKSLNYAIKKLNLKVLKKSSVAGLIEVVGYTKKLPESVMVKGEKINIQIAVKNNKLIIGYPLILQGF